MRKIIIFFIAGLLMGDQIQNTGTSALVFLKMDPGARSSGMGGAFSAIADDPTAVFFNPAGLTQIDRPSIVFSRVNWIMDTYLSMMSSILPAGNYGSFGFALLSFNSGEIDETTIYNPDGTGRSFEVNDYLLLVTYARQLTDRLSVGMNVKLANEKILHEQARALALDFGSLFLTGFLNSKLALVLSNFGSTAKFQGRDLLVEIAQGEEAYLRTYEWNLPLLFRAALAGNFTYHLIDGTWSVEMVDSRDAPPRLNLGIELKPFKYFALRGGYKYGYDSGGLSFGTGLKISLKGFKSVSVDYSYSDMSRLGKVDRLSVCFEF